MQSSFQTLSTSNADDAAMRANVLMDALPYIREFSGSAMVIKYGGHAMGDRDAAENFARNIVLLKEVGIRPVIVHGGGPQIGEMLKRLNVESEFVDGLRVTNQDTLDVVEMVLGGTVNMSVVQALQAAGGRAVGLSGKDGGLIQARKYSTCESRDLGFVGTPNAVDPYVIHALIEKGIIPVVAPIAADVSGQTYNINADTVAGAIAVAIDARRLYLLTDVAGVLDQDKKLISDLTTEVAQSYIEKGIISGGMIPKVEICMEAVAQGVEGAVIVDGRVCNAILLELFTREGTGTFIHPSSKRLSRTGI